MRDKLSCINHQIYWKNRFGAIMLLHACSLMLTSICIAQNTAPSDSGIDQRRQKYHQADKNRLAIQQKTSSYFSMDNAYSACISKSATDERCDNALSDLQENLNRATAANGSNPNPVDTVEPNNEATIIIQDNRGIWPPRYPTGVYRNPRPTPRNYYTPKPGFVPENKFQGGDGF